MPFTGFLMPRIDRIASVYLSHPLARVIGAVSAIRVPILMYHSVSENLFGKSHPYYQINTAPEVFAKQMRWMRANGYRTLDLTEMWTAMEAGQDLSKTVVITFDDGYRDFYTDAFDALRQCGFTATIFLATDRIQRYVRTNRGRRLSNVVRSGGAARWRHAVRVPHGYSPRLAIAGPRSNRIRGGPLQGNHRAETRGSGAVILLPVRISRRR